MSKKFINNIMMVFVKCRPASVESHNTIGSIEHYHAPLRQAWNIINQDVPATNAKDRAANLQAAIKTVNDSIGPNGLIPTLLVFGTLPHLALPTDSTTPNITQHTTTLHHAM